MVSLPRSTRELVAPWLALLLWACASSAARPASAPREGRFVTAAQIERSGASDAWEAVRRNVPSLEASETANGQPTGLHQRGRTSVMLDDTPIITLDGTRIGDIAALRAIPADQLLSIQILNGPAATKYFGTGASGGAILVRTKRGVVPDEQPPSTKPKP